MSNFEHLQESFNSKLVRLKDAIIADGDGTWKFQFQTGAIKSQTHAYLHNRF